MAKVKVQQGLVGGCQKKTENGFEYLSFLKIPYASPPVGELRFKSPQPPKPWQGERFYTIVDENNICPQKNRTYHNTNVQRGTFEQIVGSEDCLYLNVFTPELPTKGANIALPVIVIIHGGGFVIGNGILQQEKGPNLPDPLIEHNVVVVSINYRLGAFGFLSLDIPEAAGNMGLKDQVLALQWVQNNIVSFGGDKNNVTILGVSAGGASVEYHMLSPLSKNLFSKAIAQSGSSLNHWAFQEHIKDLSVQLAKNLGYQGVISDIRGVYEHLMRQTTEDLVTASSILCYDKMLDFGFVPSKEKDFGNGEAFLTESPYVLLKQGLFQKVPLLRGFCESESAMTQLLCPNIMNQLKEDTNFTDTLKYSFHSEDIVKFNDIFTKEYFYGRTKEDIEAATEDFFSHCDFVAGIISSSKIIASHNVPVYLYMFAFMGSISIMESYCKLKRKTAQHADDFGYITGNPSDAQLNLTEKDILMRKRVSKMLTDFAKNGNPTPKVSDVVPLLWSTYNSDEQAYMVIDQEMRQENRYQPARIAIFEEIFEKYHHKKYKYSIPEYEKINKYIYFVVFFQLNSLFIIRQQ